MIGLPTLILAMYKTFFTNRNTLVTAIRRGPLNPVVDLNRSAYEPLDVGSLSQDRVLDGASCTIANNSPDGGESMQGLAELIQPAIVN